MYNNIIFALLILIKVIDCGAPPTATGIIIDSFNNTKFGALITFHCEENNNSMTAVCGSDGEWIPNPASLVCGESGNTQSPPAVSSKLKCVDVLILCSIAIVI